MTTKSWADRRREDAARDETSATPTRCSATVYGTGRGWTGHQCYRAAKVMRDMPKGFGTKAGTEPKGFCNTHDPMKVEARRTKAYDDRTEFLNRRERERRERKAKFVNSIIQAVQASDSLDGPALKGAVAAIIEEAVATGMCWARQ